MKAKIRKYHRQLNEDPFFAKLQKEYQLYRISGDFSDSQKNGNMGNTLGTLRWFKRQRKFEIPPTQRCSDCYQTSDFLWTKDNLCHRCLCNRVVEKNSERRIWWILIDELKKLYPFRGSPLSESYYFITPMGRIRVSQHENPSINCDCNIIIGDEGTKVNTNFELPKAIARILNYPEAYSGIKYFFCKGNQKRGEEKQ